MTDKPTGSHEPTPEILAQIRAIAVEAQAEGADKDILMSPKLSRFLHTMTPELVIDMVDRIAATLPKQPLDNAPSAAEEVV